MSDTQLSPNYTIAAEPWEDGEDIITIDGSPVGMTLSRKDGPAIVRWLRRGGLNGILAYARAARERDNARDGR